MIIGDRRSELASFGDFEPKRMTGTVVFIHPERRFYIVEFERGGRRWRECFYFPHRAGTLTGFDTAYGNRPGENQLERKAYTRNRKKGKKK